MPICPSRSKWYRDRAGEKRGHRWSRIGHNGAHSTRPNWTGQCQANPSPSIPLESCFPDEGDRFRAQTVAASCRAPDFNRPSAVLFLCHRGWTHSAENRTSCKSCSAFGHLIRVIRWPADETKQWELYAVWHRPFHELTQAARAPSVRLAWAVIEARNPDSRLDHAEILETARSPIRLGRVEETGLTNYNSFTL